MAEAINAYQVAFLTGKGGEFHSSLWRWKPKVIPEIASPVSKQMFHVTTRYPVTSRAHP